MADVLAPVPETLGPDEEAYAQAAQQLREEQAQARAAGSISSASRLTSTTVPAERAAEALQISQERGLAPDEVLENWDNIKATNDQERAAKILAGHEAINAYLSKSKAHLALAKPDVPVLTMLGEGLHLGVMDIGYALEANRSAKQKVSPDDDSALAAYELQSAQGVSGATTLPRKIGAEIARATPTLALFGSATTAGAAVGSFFFPGVGTAAGGALGAAGVAFTLGFGPLYRRLKSLVTDQGEPLLTDDEAKAWASGGAGASAAAQVVVGAPFLKALPGVRGALEKVGLDATTRAVQSTVTRAAAQRLAQFGGHVLSGAMAMAAQSAVNAATEELAKDRHGSNPDWDQVTHAATEGFKAGLLLFPLSAFEPLHRFADDVGRIRDARLEVARLDQLSRASRDLGILAVAPDEAEHVLGQMAAGSDGRTVYVDPAAIPEKARERVAEAIGPEQIAEAAVTKGDVAVPIETYLTRIAPDFHDAMRDHVKLSPDGLTLAEAERVRPLDALPAEERAKVEKALRPAEPKAPSPETLADQATRLVESQKLGDLAPGRRRRAAENAASKLAALGTETQLGNVEGEPQTPGRALNRLQRMAELEQARDTNLAIEKAERAARAEADGHREFLLRYTKDEARAELGKATVVNPDGTTSFPYLEQVDRLLSGFELGQNTPRTEVARRLATMDWIAKEQAENREPIIPESVLSKLDRFVHWKDLSLPELRDLRKAVESVAHQAEVKNTILERRARVDRESMKAQLITALRLNTEKKPYRPSGSILGKVDQALDTVRALKFGARAIERVINQLDGGDINGPWHRALWDPINDTTHDWHDLVRKVAEPIVKLIDDMPREDLRRWRETRFQVNGIDYDLSAAVAVALNWGNDSNRQKLVRGWQDRSVIRRGLLPWTADTPDQFLRQLRRGDWDFVQRVWDRLESMWPEASALEKRLTGLAPDKVKPRAFTRTLEDGSTVELRGGYYPVIYDPDFSRAGAAGEEAAASRSVQLFDRDYYRAATPQGHLQKRIEGFARPIVLSLDALPHKVSEAAKDATMREALLSVHSLLTDDEVRAALQTSELGRAGEKALLGWLRDTANDLAVPDNGAGTWFNFQSRTRSGYTASIFAYNLGQTAQNLTAIAPAIRAVGPKWMTDAMLRLAKEQGPLIDWMNAQSGELRNHERGGQAVADAMRTLSEKPGLTSDFMQHGMKFFQSTDIAVKYPTWLAAYMKGVAEKADGGFEFDHETAVRHADATVRLNIMAGNTKDLPAILRSKLGRFMLPLYSYNIHRLNMVADALGAVRGAVRERAVGRAAGIMAGAWGAFAAEAVLSELVKGNGPSDENNDGTVDATDTAIWTAKISVLSPLLWIPVLGSAVKSAATGKAPMGTPESTVMGDVGAAVLKTGKVGYNALSEDETVDEEQVKSLALQLLKVGGDLGGVPAQVRTTLGYALDENSPKEDPLQIGLGTAFGKSRPGKLIKLTE